MITHVCSEEFNLLGKKFAKLVFLCEVWYAIVAAHVKR